MFDRLQFHDPIERVVLVLAASDGGCDPFSLYYLDDASDLAQSPDDYHAAPVPDDGKWTHLFLSNKQRALFRHVSSDGFVTLGNDGKPEVGIVTGANSFFTISEATRAGPPGSWGACSGRGNATRFLNHDGEPAQPTRSARTDAGIDGNSPSNALARTSNPLNADPADGLEFGGTSDANARATVFRAKLSRSAIARCDNPSAT